MVMTERRAWGWLGPASGIVFSVLLAVAIGLVGDADVEADDPAERIAQELTEMSDENELSFVLFGLGLLFFIFFLGYLRDRLRAVPAEGQWLVSVVWAGGLLFSAVYLMLGFAQAAQFSIENYGGDVQAAKAIFAFSWNAILLFAPPIAAMTGAAAVLILRFGVLPKWLGWLAILAFLAGLVAPWIPIFELWILALAIVLLIEERRGPRRAAVTQG
jgi:hypothetical protein